MLRMVLAVSTVLLTSCASSGISQSDINPYEKFYKSNNLDSSQLADIPAEFDPQIVFTDYENVERAWLHQVSLGMHAVGFSEFQSRIPANTDAAVKLARMIPAERALIQHPKLASSENRMINIPRDKMVNYGTMSRPDIGFEKEYVPTQITVDTYENAAVFFRSAKEPCFKAIGWVFRELTPEQRTSFGRNTGAYVAYVRSGSPAFYANILEGDLIVALQGKQIRMLDDACETNLENTPGRLMVTVLRNGKEVDIQLEL